MEVRSLLIDFVMDTDMARHSKNTSYFANKVNSVCCCTLTHSQLVFWLDYSIIPSLAVPNSLRRLVLIYVTPKTDE